MSLTDRNGGSVYGVATPATITLCPGATYKELVTSGTTESRLHNWINKSAICSAPAIGSDGSLGYVPEAIFLERQGAAALSGRWGLSRGMHRL